LKPFCPLCLPWQPPLLQPSFVNTGTTWLRKLTGGVTRSLHRHLRRRAAAADRRRDRARAVAGGRHTPSALTVATFASDEEYVALRL